MDVVIRLAKSSASRTGAVGRTVVGDENVAVGSCSRWRSRVRRGVALVVGGTETRSRSLIGRWSRRVVLASRRVPSLSYRDRPCPRRTRTPEALENGRKGIRITCRSVNTR